MAGLGRDCQVVAQASAALPAAAKSSLQCLRRPMLKQRTALTSSSGCTHMRLCVLSSACSMSNTAELGWLLLHALICYRADVPFLYQTSLRRMADRTVTRTWVSHCTSVLVCWYTQLFASSAP